MSRLIIGLLATFIIASPLAQAQYRNYGYGSGGGVSTGGGVSLGPGGPTNTQLPGPSGSFYYPGFGWSSRPLNGYGPYYGGTPYATNVYGSPIYTAPLAVPGLGGYFRIGGARVNYWQAPSGYYYPWGVGAAYNQTSPVYIVNQGVTTPQLPPISSMFTDMEKYMDDSKDKKKLSQTDYARLFRRLQDLRGKYDHQRGANGGTMDPGDEESIRRDVDNLGGELSRAVKPAPAAK